MIGKIKELKIPVEVPLLVVDEQFEEEEEDNTTGGGHIHTQGSKRP